jgi:hypothetical protein
LAPVQAARSAVRCRICIAGLKELETYIPFPPLQNPASYNLDQVMQQVKDMKMASHAGE